MASGIVSLTIGIREDDRDAVLVSIPMFIMGIVAYFIISAYAQLLGNSAHQLRLMAYDFLLTHNSDDDNADEDGYNYR